MTSIAWGRPRTSTALCSFTPDIFFPRVKALFVGGISVFNAFGVHNYYGCLLFAPVNNAFTLNQFAQNAIKDAFLALFSLPSEIIVIIADLPFRKVMRQRTPAASFPQTVQHYNIFSPFLIG